MPEASSEYFAILTNRGTEKLAAYLQSGEKITISYVLVGDGNGSIPMPDPTRTALVHEVWRGPAETVLDEQNKNVIKATSTIPTDVGGWNVREIGLLDDDGELFAVANAPGYPKISIADGINNDMRVGMRVAVSNRDGINIKVDGTVIIATIGDIEEHNKNKKAHDGHFEDMELHVSDDDRDNWDNPLLVMTVLADSEDWEREEGDVTYTQDVTAQFPEDTVLPNMDLALKGDPNLLAQMVDRDIGLVAEQSGGQIILHALREAPDINMYLQISLYRSKSGEEKTYYSNLLGNPGEIGTPLPEPISKASIQLENQSTSAGLKVHGTHVNPTMDWAATRIVRGEGVAPIGPSDGVLIMDGTGTEFDDTNGLKAGVKYIYAYFPRNSAGNYQMSATTAEITIPTQKPLAPTNLQVQDSTDAGAFGATLTWEAQTDVYRDHFAVVRKEGSAPTSLEDGKVVYEGTDTTCRDTQSTNYGIQYYWTVFAVNTEGTVSDSSPSTSLTLQPIVPGQVSNLTATDTSSPEYGYRVMLQYQMPADVNAYKVVIRRKQGEMPATSIDGTQIYEGSNEIYYDTPPYSSQAYYYRAFTVNQVGQMNDSQEGAVASVTLTAREPGSISNLQASDEKGTTTGSFDLPTVQLEGREVVNRFVAGYVVIQKEDSTPASETDGEVIASGDIDPVSAQKTVSFTKVDQANGANLFITVFLKNAAGSYFWTSGQVVNVVPETLPTYTFTGQLLFIDDGNGDWRIKLLSSGVLEWMSPDALLDIFMVGGGASGTPNGGGGGGYTKTQKKYEIKKGQRIQVQVGAGGASGNSSSGNNGGTSSFDTLSVGGGATSSGHYAGNGGSGGGGSVFNKTSDAGNGGTDGASGGGTYSVGSANQYHTYAGGSGQGTTTREFGDAGAELYSGGGGGLCRHKSGGSVHGSAGSGGSGSPVLAGRGTYKSSSSTSDFFSGGGAGGGYGGGGGAGDSANAGNYGNGGGAGAQGIVIIRNARA